MKEDKSLSKFQRSRNYTVTGKDSNYLLLLTRYFNSIQDEIKKILMSEKNMNEIDAKTFIDNMFSLHYKMMKNLKGEIKEYYSAGLSVKECAKKIIDKYYKITKVNKYPESVPADEIIGVLESKYYHFKMVSPSLFWNFIKKTNKLNLKYNLDLSYIESLYNSLNHNNDMLYMETKSVNIKDVIDTFMYSNLFSKINKVINNKKYNVDDLKFFTSIDKNGKLRFGYIIEDSTYTIGKIDYKTTDIKRLIPYINVLNDNIDLYKVVNKFKTNIWYNYNYKNILDTYLSNYGNVKIYSDIIDNKIVLIVKSIGNEDVLNKNYIKSILDDNINPRFKNVDINIDYNQKDHEEYYYITIR